MQDYTKYFLKDNPFPDNPAVDPYSSDPRTNGTVFCETVSQKEILSLSGKLASKVNLIYVSGYEFERGIGKSAIIVHEWKELKKKPETTSVFVRCKRGEKASDFCGTVISRWHTDNYLWRSMKSLLTRYSLESHDLRLTPEAVETMFQRFDVPPEEVPLTLYTHYSSADALARNFARWLSLTVGASKETSYYWAYCYLMYPSQIESDVCGSKGRRVDRIELLGDFLSILTAGGFKEHYIFLDQLEDAMMALPASKVGDFCLDMRRMLEKVSGKGVITCTLHPDSEVRLDDETGKHLTSLAPLDALHRVDVIKLKSLSDEAVLLAVEYMKSFRTAQPPSETYPFDKEALRYICFLKRGNKREYLAILCSCLKYGASLGADKITLDFITHNHKETMGQVKDEELLKKFKEEEMKHVKERSDK